VEDAGFFEEGMKIGSGYFRLMLQKKCRVDCGAGADG
jgi:hypothetical protein